MESGISVVECQTRNQGSPGSNPSANATVSVVFVVVDVPCPGPLHFSHIADYHFCPLPDPDVGLSVFVCDVVHTFFHFGLWPEVC